jgi:hypothetical protein
MYEDERVGTLTASRDEAGVIHVNIVNVDNEWIMEDGIWVQVAPF